jgi:hypothetical protein
MKDDKRRNKGISNTRLSFDVAVRFVFFNLLRLCVVLTVAVVKRRKCTKTTNHHTKKPNITIETNW